jgi:terminase small subunit-like protein
MAGRANLSPNRALSSNGKPLGRPRIGDPDRGPNPYAATPAGQQTPKGRTGYAEKRQAARQLLQQASLRPRVFSREMAAAICQRMSEGETVAAIARDPAMPSFPTIYAWRQTNPEFASWFDRAREIQSHALVDQTVAIADDESKDLLYRANGDPVPNNAAVQRGRLRVDSRRWLAGKLNPAAYADKQIHTGPDGFSPMEMQIRADYDRLSVEELDQLRELLERAAGAVIEGDATPVQEVEEKPAD